MFFRGLAVRVPVPVNKTVLVEANVPEDASFRQTVTVTPEHRHKEVVIRLIEQRWSESYGFHASELPKETGFVPLAAPRPGKPAASAFLERYEGLARHMVPTTLFSNWFLIDGQGDVWRAHRRWPSADIKSAPEPSFRQFGRLDPAVFERMKSLREDAKGSLEPVERCGGCMGCGSSSISIHGVGFADKNGVTIASGRATCERSPGPAAKTIAAWMVALAKQVPHGR